eukprot:g24083.t1
MLSVCKASKVACEWEAPPAPRLRPLVAAEVPLLSLGESAWTDEAETSCEASESSEGSEAESPSDLNAGVSPWLLHAIDQAKSGDEDGWNTSGGPQGPGAMRAKQEDLHLVRDERRRAAAEELLDAR